MLFSFSRCLHFCPDFFGHAWKQLDEKAKVNLKVYDVANWETITIYIVKTRSKGDQTMKFGQLVEYSVRNIFLQKPFGK